MRCAVWLVVVTFGAGCGGDTMPGIESYLRPEPYPKLEIEVDHVPGMEPRAWTKSQLIDGLGTILDKPGGIQVLRDQPLEAHGPTGTWTLDELQRLAEDTFDHAAAGDTIRMHALFVDGHYVEDTADSKVLGLAWSNTHVALFKQTIEETCGSASIPAKDKLCALTELAVWTHEIGHVIGLVDNGLPMVASHLDTEHGHHCDDPKCIMYWQADTPALVSLLRDRIAGGNTSPLGFGAACQADIATVRDGQ